MAEFNYVNVIQRAKEELRQASSSERPLREFIVTRSWLTSTPRHFANLTECYHHDFYIDVNEWEKETLDDPLETHGDGSLEWVATHLPQLIKDYPDRFILVEKGNVIADSSDIADILQQALKLGIASPLIIDTQSSPAVSRTAY